MNCNLRVTSADRDVAHVAVRRERFAVGRPIEFDEKSPRIAAIEYALGALGAEVVNGLRVFASRRRVAVDAVEALISGDVEHDAVFLGVVGESGTPRIGRIHLKVFVDSPVEDEVRRLWTDMLDKLPLVCTLRLAVPIEFELILTA